VIADAAHVKFAQLATSVGVQLATALPARRAEVPHAREALFALVVVLGVDDESALASTPVATHVNTVALHTIVHVVEAGADAVA